MIADLSIVGFPFLIGVAVLTAVVIASAVGFRHHMNRLATAAVWLMIVALLAGNAAGWVNRHFDSVRTVDELFGRTAQDQSSVGAVTRQKVVPKHGRVITIPIPATRSGFAARDALVYLPPAWFETPRPHLPVIELLAGEPGSTDNWTQGGLADVTSDAYAATHLGLAPVLVMADNNGGDTSDTECVGKAEQYLTVDVPRFVGARFGTAMTPEQWAIGGLSEGGMCGLMLSLRHPERYKTFVDFGGLLGPREADGNNVGDTVRIYFNGDETEFAAHEPLDILRTKRFGKLRGWFQVGSDDADPLAAQQSLVPAARRAGVTTCSVVVPGGEHTFQLWTEAFKRSLPWVAARLGIGPPVTKCPHQ